MFSQERTNDYYTYIAYYDAGEYRSQNKNGNDFVINQNGAYTTWDIPDIYNRMSGLRIYMRGRARVTNYTNNQALNLFPKYEHTFWGWDFHSPTFSWSLAGVAPGVTAEFKNQTNTYYSLCNLDYDPNSNYK